MNTQTSEEKSIPRSFHVVTKHIGSACNLGSTYRYYRDKENIPPEKTIGTTTIATHRVYDAFGNKTNSTHAAVDCVFGYTGKLFDADTKLQNNLNRWYEPATGKWLSKDPIGFTSEDVNLYRYANNSSLQNVDPIGNRFTLVGPNWGPVATNQFNNSIDRLATKIIDLMNKINNELNSLSPCLKDILGPGLDALKRRLYGVLQAFYDPLVNINVYNPSSGVNSSSQAHGTPPDIWGDGYIDFNNDNGWPTWSPESIDILIIHELWHWAGAPNEQTDTGNGLNPNADNWWDWTYTIEPLFSDNFSGLGNIYGSIKIAAQIKCAPKELNNVCRPTIPNHGSTDPHLLPNGKLPYPFW